MVDKFKELFEELKTLREPLLHHLRLIENKKDRNISGGTMYLSKNDLTNLLNLSNKYNSKLNILHTNEGKDDFDRLTISFWLKNEKKDKFVESLEETGAKVVTEKTIEEKKMKKTIIKELEKLKDSIRLMVCNKSYNKYELIEGVKKENEIGKFIIKLRETYIKYKKEHNYGR